MRWTQGHETVNNPALILRVTGTIHVTEIDIENNIIYTGEEDETSII